MKLDRGLYFRVCAYLRCLATFGWGDLSTPSVVRCQYAVIAGEIDPELVNQCRQSSYEIHRLEGYLGRSIPVGRLQGIDHLAGGAE